MKYDIRMISTYSPPRPCGIGEFARNLATGLESFTKEVGQIRVAAITDTPREYDVPVDIIIDQYNPNSWESAALKIIDNAQDGMHPVVLLQHEYGLDYDPVMGHGRGRNYINMAKKMQQEGIITIVYLHTILRKPDEYQKGTLQEMSEHTDGLIVTTKSAIDILTGVYGIKREKIKHIDHGTRERNLSETDRFAIKKRYGMQDNALVTTLGLLSPGKGIQYSIPAYARFVKESLTKEQRRKFVYLIAGDCHPNFVTENEGKPYREYIALLEHTLGESGLNYSEVRALEDADFEKSDIVMLKTYLNEELFRMCYGATNAMVLPYLDMEQISSGILADTIGSGRISTSTKNAYARELIADGNPVDKGFVVNPLGIMVDPFEASVDQIAQGLDYLFIGEKSNPEAANKRRLLMESSARDRGHEMAWPNVVWKLIRFISYIEDGKQLVTRRGPVFTREKESPYRQLNEELERR